MKILNFGSLNVDHFYQMDAFVRPGETKAALSHRLACGGKGLNQSVAMARAGATVYHAGMTGANDGQLLRRTLEEAGVNTEFVLESRQVDSGHAIIQVDGAGQNCIIIYGGANQSIGEEMICSVLDSFAPGDMLVLQNEISGLSCILRQAKLRRLRIALNPSPIDERLLGAPLENVDLMIFNETEAFDLCGEQDVDRQINAMSARFPAADLVLTIGERGAIYRGCKDEAPEFFPASSVKAVNTTAAGDTFLGYFIACIAQGKPPALAMKTATVAAGICVTRFGAADSIPFAKEVEAAMAGM